MYHHHILSLDENETVRKMYNKQKQTNSKGDWYDLLLKDFKFIGKDIKIPDIFYKILKFLGTSWASVIAHKDLLDLIIWM